MDLLEKEAQTHSDSQENTTQYDLPDFAKETWEVSQETRSHMDSVAKEQRVAEQKSGEWRFA